MTHKRDGLPRLARLGLPGVGWDGSGPRAGAGPNTALEATGHSVGFLAGVRLYRVARASAWALDYSRQAARSGCSSGYVLG